MTFHSYTQGRFFLKDTIRQQIDFSSTDQSRGLPAPSVQKPCPTPATVINLPNGREALLHLGTLSVGEAILQRESIRRYARLPLSLPELSMLLYAIQGVREKISPECALRTVPSAGARHTFETYLAVSNVESLTPGLYRYLPFNEAIVFLYEDSQIGIHAAAACYQQSFVARAAVVFFWTTIPSRMEWRYAEAAHKVIAIDAGHVCQNLYVAAQSIDVGVCAIAAYNQTLCDTLLQVDGEEEFTIYIASVGKCL